MDGASRLVSSSASSSLPAGRPDGGGAGLGLAIARGFVEANGGRVWAESRAGQGATFVLALPRERGRGVSGARILVVDDEPQILRALRTSLRAAGYVVETADTAQGALAEVGDATTGRRDPRPDPPRRDRDRGAAASSAHGARRR